MLNRCPHNVCVEVMGTCVWAVHVVMIWDGHAVVMFIFVRVMFIFVPGRHSQGLPTLPFPAFTTPMSATARDRVSGCGPPSLGMVQKLEMETRANGGPNGGLFIGHVISFCWLISGWLLQNIGLLKLTNGLLIEWCVYDDDSKTCHTADSDSRWRHFYLVSWTKAQCESAI